MKYFSCLNEVQLYCTLVVNSLLWIDTINCVISAHREGIIKCWLGQFQLFKQSLAYLCVIEHLWIGGGVLEGAPPSIDLNPYYHSLTQNK